MSENDEVLLKHSRRAEVASSCFIVWTILSLSSSFTSSQQHATFFKPSTTAQMLYQQRSVSSFDVTHKSRSKATCMLGKAEAEGASFHAGRGGYSSSTKFPRERHFGANLLAFCGAIFCLTPKPAGRPLFLLLVVWHFVKTKPFCKGRIN